MRAIRTFLVRPRLPEPISALATLASNLRWAWDDRARELFRWVDPDTWERLGHDPVAVLNQASRSRLESLAADPAFLAFLHECEDDLRRELSAQHWFQRRHGSLGSVAYFSPEFGIAAALPQYSGGLGVLAGDHLKACSGLGVPLVGVGLFYRHGYFRQELTPDGWQQERYVVLDPHSMALHDAEETVVEVDLAGRPLVARVWRAQVGRVPLFLLDSDVEQNDDVGRQVTDRLYGGDSEHRLQQEILLGIGGVRALDAMGIEPEVFHSNEGHAGFLGLERIRHGMVEHGLSFAEAVEVVRASTVFTTHTPVPAGIDRFPRDLMQRYFGPWAEEFGVDFDEVMALGHMPGEPPDAPFNMAVMGLRLSGWANAVSRLHGAVSRRIFANLWPDVPEHERPIGHVTNGVHTKTWVSPEMRDLLDRHVLPGWAEAGPDRWTRVANVSDEELWRVLAQGRERLVLFVRRRLRESAMARGASEPDVAWCDEVFSPDALTIGFARRFASYKRATLLLSQPERLERILLSTERPVQLVFSGKAHPADDMGKEMIRQIVQFARRTDLRHRVAFLEDYDIGVARNLYQGCDVWLNTPRRPLEACGTSGEKAAVNGALNCSISDGWWDEWADGRNGWVIPSAESEQDLARRDLLEANSLFEILERHVIPLFYERRDSRPPARWLDRVRHSLQSLGPNVPAARMVRQYVQEFYEPAARRAQGLRADGFARARALAAWKDRVRKAWGGVQVLRLEGDGTVEPLGGQRRVEAVVALAGLRPDDVRVECVHGPVGPADELVQLTPVTMTRLDGVDGDQHRYEGHVPCERAGRYGYTVRVVPSHPDLGNFTELAVTWA
jgi:starch phosphorylase